MYSQTPGDYLIHSNLNLSAFVTSIHTNSVFERLDRKKGKRFNWKLKKRDPIF
jgi:hypothetical protein